jgi:hypothetical protein
MNTSLSPDETPRRRIHIGNVIRQALVFNPRNSPGGAVNTDTLLQTVARLFALLDHRQIDYLLVGGIALLQYIEGRNTDDIDLIAAVSSLDKLPEIQIIDQNEHFARCKFEELRIDLPLTRHPLFDKVRRDYAVTQHFVEQDVPCATVEGLLLLKFYALPSLYRQGSFARVGIYENDIATLIHDYRPQLEPLFAELALHLSQSDLAAVRQIGDEIQQRIDRFQLRSE